MLAGRMRQATVPRDLCGRTVQSLYHRGPYTIAGSIAGMVLTDSRPGSAPRRYEIDPGALLPLRQALAAQDMPAIRALNPSWVAGYDAGRDASYCTYHPVPPPPPA